MFAAAVEQRDLGAIEPHGQAVRGGESGRARAQDQDPGPRADLRPRLRREGEGTEAGGADQGGA
jgi:hypothetical protein